MRTQSDFLLNLMCAAGMMVLVGAIPVGIETGWLGFARGHLDKWEAFQLGLYMLALTAATGFVLYGVSLYFLRRRRASAAT